MSRSVKRVCVIGLDGVGLNNIRIFLDKLPLNGMSRIINKGFTSSFISIPPYTPNAWTSIFTGVNPGKHGIYGFYRVSRIDGYKVSTVSSYDVMYPRIFEMLSMSNLRSIVINVPLVYPIHGLVGLRNLVAISDWASPRQFIHPKQYEEKYRECLIEPPHEWWLITPNVKSYARLVEGFLKKRLGLYYELLEEEFDLFVVVFSELDWLMHKIPDIVEGRRLNLIYKVFSLVDDFIRSAYEICDLVVLVSDHGFTVPKLFISVNSILANNGLITYSYISHILNRFNIGKLLHLQGQDVTLFTNDTERGFGRLPSLIFHNLSMLAEKIVPLHALRRLGTAIVRNIDYRRSKAFMIEPSTWGIYVERKYLDIVKSIFNNIKFIRRILHRDEIFWGPYVEEAPDLILIPQSRVFFDAMIHDKPMYVGYAGEHDPQALVAFYGDDVLSLGSISGKIDVSIYDLVPTILAYMGLPVSSDTDGTPLTNVFNLELSSAKKRANYLQKFRTLRKLQKVK